MDTMLTNAERARFEAALGALFATAQDDDEEAWGNAVASALKTLVGATGTLLVLQRGRATRAYGDAVPTVLLRRYLSPPAAGLADGIEEAEVVERTAASDADAPVRARVWRRPARADAVGLDALSDVVSLDGHDPTGNGHGDTTYEAVGFTTEFGVPGTYARVTCHHEPARDPAETRRYVRLLSLLLPAFAVAARARARAAPRALLAKLLDAVGTAGLLCARTGEVVHANAAYRHLLEAEPEASRLQLEVTRAVRALSAANTDEVATHPVRTERGSYLLRCAVLAAEGIDAHSTLVAVTVDRAQAVVAVPTVAADGRLRERFGLTSRELEVARLLSAGKSNASVANTLGISPCTARHHTERVLAKLGAHSRAEVSAILLGVARAD